MREEVLSSVGAQDTDRSGYELSDLEDIEFSWENPAVDMDSVYRPGIDTPFSASFFDDFQMGSTAANPIKVDDETTKKTRRIQLQQQQHQGLSVQPNFRDYEKLSIRDSKRKCVRLRIQDSVSLKFVLYLIY